MGKGDNTVARECDGNRRWYDSVAGNFVRRYEGFEGEYYRRFEEDVFAAMIDAPRGGPLLDLGCGHGRFVQRHSRDSGRLVVGVDLSLEMLRQGSRDLPLAQANAARLCFRDGSFSGIVCMGLFEYMEDATAFLAEINRVTSKDGLLAFTFHQRNDSADSPAERDDAPYYGKTVGERGRLWRRVTRTLLQMENDLAASGYETVSVRRIFFRLPRVAFRAGVVLRDVIRPLGELVIDSAVHFDRILGAYFSRGSNGNTIILARKTN